MIAEIGINHNGDVNIARKLIDGAIFAGSNTVKFQKRTIERVYTKEYLDSPRESPWGKTQRDQKLALEFGEREYDVIDSYCKEREIDWFASAWDLESVEFLTKYNLKYNKIPSALLTHKELLKSIAKQKKHTFISTGMSSLEEINEAVNIFKKASCPFELMHCNSAYPVKDEDVNLNIIPFLRRQFKCDVGYSGHEVGIITSVAAVVFGITSLERHITLDRAMFGSDQAASVEVMGFHRLVSYIRTVESALGDGIKKVAHGEIVVREKLRRYEDVGVFQKQYALSV
jgi:N-acetylneuraminate synthase